MASIFTTPDMQAAAKSFMHDVLVAAGRINSQRQSSTRVFTYPNEVTAAQAISDELINREFKNIDSGISRLSGESFAATINGGGWKRFKSEQIAKAIVYFAELNNMYWDDTIRTPYEIDEFKKTILGTAVYKYGRYISAIQDPKAAKTRSNSASTGTNGTSATPSAPQNGYKSSGPQSGNVRDLKGNPGDKVLANTNLIFKIIADKVGKNTPNVFIKPLSASGETNGTNKIFISSGNGYTDCTCYFDDVNDAQVFLDKIVNAGRVPANINNLRVVKMNADPNGYFLVGTEFGVCAISAKKLNEAIEEDLVEAIDPDYTCWDKAYEGRSEENKRELIDYMHKG
jgi:hypothetical protein